MTDGFAEDLAQLEHGEGPDIAVLDDPRRGHFTEEDRDVAHIFARHAAVALSRARDTANLWKAIDARQRIGQAQGILMERFSIDADHAFAVLRR